MGWRTDRGPSFRDCPLKLIITMDSGCEYETAESESHFRERLAKMLSGNKGNTSEHCHSPECLCVYPLELDEQLHINLWAEHGMYKWSIALWVDDKEGSQLRFVGSRPLDPRVNWKDFELIVRQGQRLADKRWIDSRTRNDPSPMTGEP